MRRLLFQLTALSVLVTLSVASVAWAHVVVTPDEVPADSYEVLNVRAPNEKNIPTTEVKVNVPDGFTVVGVQPVPGWNHEFQKQDGVIKSITWSGGEINVEEFQQFSFQASTPEKGGEFTWKATQTYEDGSVVEWIGPPDSEKPASIVEVAAQSSGSGGHGDGMEEMEAGGHDMGSMGSTAVEGQASANEPLPDTGGSNAILYGGAAALILGTILMLRLRRMLN